MWHIGQTIVAVKSHRQYFFKEGDIFEIKALRQSLCECRQYQIDIGFVNPYKLICCGKCKFLTNSKDSIAWFSERCFKPLDELADISELTEILENTQPFEVK